MDGWLLTGEVPSATATYVELDAFASAQFPVDVDTISDTTFVLTPLQSEVRRVYHTGSRFDTAIWIEAFMRAAHWSVSARAMAARAEVDDEMKTQYSLVRAWVANCVRARVGSQAPSPAELTVAHKRRDQSDGPFALGFSDDDPAPLGAGCTVIGVARGSALLIEFAHPPWRLTAAIVSEALRDASLETALAALGESRAALAAHGASPTSRRLVRVHWREVDAVSAAARHDAARSASAGETTAPWSGPASIRLPLACTMDELSALAAHALDVPLRPAAAGTDAGTDAETDAGTDAARGAHDLVFHFRNGLPIRDTTLLRQNVNIFVCRSLSPLSDAASAAPSAAEEEKTAVPNGTESATWRSSDSAAHVRVGSSSESDGAERPGARASSTAARESDVLTYLPGADPGAVLASAIHTPLLLGGGASDTAPRHRGRTAPRRARASSSALPPRGGVLKRGALLRQATETLLALAACVVLTALSAALLSAAAGCASALRGSAAASTVARRCETLRRAPFWLHLEPRSAAGQGAALALVWLLGSALAVAALVAGRIAMLGCFWWARRARDARTFNAAAF